MIPRTRGKDNHVYRPALTGPRRAALISDWTWIAAPCPTHCYAAFLEIMMKIQKSVKHDSLSLKVVEGKDWVRLSVGRRGWKITGKGESMRGVAEKVERLFREATKSGMPYGKAIDHVEAELASGITRDE